MPPEPEEVSFRDDLKATMAELAEGGGDEPADDATPDRAEDAAPETPEAAPGDDDAGEPVEAAPADAEPPEGAQEPSEAAVQAPHHWPTEDKEFFASLPDDATRERVLNLQRGVERRADARYNAAADARKLATEIDGIMQPFEQTLALNGMSKVDAIRQLAAAEMQLQKDPVAGLEWLAQRYGARVAGTESAQTFVRRIAAALKVDIGGGQEQPGNAQQVDPRDARIRALEERDQARERAAQEAQQLQLQQAVVAADTSIKTFADAKDANGNPAHPHFETVKSMMGAMIQAASASGETMSLDEAYTRATWARPDLRETLLAAQRAEASKTASTASKAAVAKAKNAQTPRTANVAVPPPDDADLTQKDLLTKVFRDRTSGAGARQ